ncbi:hypothetical protein GPECTOR_27g665 [Gonium pectorale]|uniref:ubiquitinyl hydrolase 1 n=1 Tax=Gonium pectorale TaxID=33097 RepID=A0A150GFX1_GONPE|nr:hypothetical protein GPECTOR_27g665 [Gonium pectorale]|eukprot:KXZ48495.1 hypothetical protein GPECTOR_27g665 [Gonium pectorale]
MDAASLPAGSVWARRSAAPERNWWEVINDRKPSAEELAAAAAGVSRAAPTPDADTPARLPQCACLQCGDLIPTPKTCGNCKLAAYWLQAAEKERIIAGKPRPPPPAPDPPLELPSSELAFSREGYATLLEAHRRCQKVAAASGSGSTSGSASSLSNDDGSEERDGVSAAGRHRSPSTDAASSLSALAGCADGSWSWSWEEPGVPQPELLTPPRPVGILNSGNSCYAASAIQEDAHELLAKLLEALAEVALAEAGGKTALRARAAAVAKAQASASASASAPLANGHGAGSAEAHKLKTLSPPPPPPPPPQWRGDESCLTHHVLGGYLRRATLCDVCGYASQSHEWAQSLELPLGPSVRSVAGALAGYFADEVLDAGNEYRCERCRQLVCATRQVRLEAAPNALALTLKRFVTMGGQARKNTQPVTLCMKLDLERYMAPGALDCGPVTYRLYGVIRHMGLMPPGLSSLVRGGSLNMGHYVALVRGGDGAWYCCDDDEVTQISESDVSCVTDAYMLFYARDEPRLPPEPPAPAEAHEEDAAAAASSSGAQSEEEEEETRRPNGASATGELRSRSAAPQSATPPPPTTADHEWGSWLEACAGPPAAAPAANGGGGTKLTGSKPPASRTAVRPHFQLVPPAHRGAASGASVDGAVWTLVVHMPGVKSSRDIKLASTTLPGAAAASAGAAAPAAERAPGGAACCPGRLRVWVSGVYSLDLQLGVAWGASGAQPSLLAVTGSYASETGKAGEEGEDHSRLGGAESAAVPGLELEVLGPRWRPASMKLRVPLRLTVHRGAGKTPSG